MYWDESLNANWEHTHKDFKNAFNEALNMGVDEEKIFFFRAVVHSLIERNYREEWDRETFLEKYRIHIEWIKGGIFNEIS